MSVVCGNCIRYYHVMSSYVFYTLSLYIFMSILVLYTTIFCLVNKSCVLEFSMVLPARRHITVLKLSNKVKPEHRETSVH